MISDEPDEDADTLDDDTILDTVYAGDTPFQSPDTIADAQDWPPLAQHDAYLNVDPATLAWFKSNHADWPREIARVLRAWVLKPAQAKSPY